MKPAPAPVPFTFVRNKGKETKQRLIQPPKEVAPTKGKSKVDANETPAKRASKIDELPETECEPVESFQAHVHYIRTRRWPGFR